MPKHIASTTQKSLTKNRKMSKLLLDLEDYKEFTGKDWAPPETHRGERSERVLVNQQSQIGYVYLLAGGGYCKIGCSRNAEKRRGQISPKLPFKVEPICTIVSGDMYGLETELHRRFADKRTNGEWFELDPEDIEYIKGLGGQDVPQHQTTH